MESMTMPSLMDIIILGSRFKVQGSRFKAKKLYLLPLTLRLLSGSFYRFLFTLKRFFGIKHG
jgi:hypothetical protein